MKTAKSKSSRNPTNSNDSVGIPPPSSTRVPPKKGWDVNARHTVQYGFKLLGRPPQFVHDKDQWRGPDGAIARLMEYVVLSGNRTRSTVKWILLDCVANDDSYDADNRHRMQQSRKRNLSQAQLCGKGIKAGTGSFSTAAYANHNRIHRMGGKGVSRSTLLDPNYQGKIRHEMPSPPNKSDRFNERQKQFVVTDTVGSCKTAKNKFNYHHQPLSSFAQHLLSVTW